MKRRVVLVVAAVAAVAAATGWWWLASPPADSRPPGILLITLDTTRADHLGAYGARDVRTPALDALAASGVVFDQAVAAAPTTLPAHASLLTGRNPPAHGVRNNGMPLADDVPTLAAALQSAGYRTAAFVSAFVLDRRFGLSRGFEVYDDQLDPRPGGPAELIERRADHTVAAAARWLAAERGGAPFFAWVHLYDPHDPYDAPAPYGAAFAARPYDGEIAFVDAMVADLLGTLDRLGLRQRTIVAVVGDHGESLGEHGEATHGLFVYDATMRVPAILAWPSHLGAGQRIAPLVRAIDVAPTLLDLAGRPALADAEGQSLLPLVRGAGQGPAAAYGETLFPELFMDWAPLHSIRDGRWKFIDAPDAELYDLRADPGELHNLAATDPARAAGYAQSLAGATAANAARPASGLDRDTAARLAALGYVGTPTARASGPAAPRRDPKAMIGVFNRLREANGDLLAGRVVEAGRSARATLADDPGNAFALLIVGRSAMAQGRYAEAATVLRDYLGRVPTSADAHHWLAICQLQLGDEPQALREVDAALAIDARFSEARALRGDLLAVAGRTAEGVTDLRAAIALNPDKGAYRVSLGRVLMRAGQPAEASAAFAAAIARGTGRDDVRFEYARALEAAGHVAEARSAYAAVAAAADAPEPARAAARQALLRLGGTSPPQPHSP